MRLAVDTIASSEPSTAARSHLERSLQCASRCRIGPRFTPEPHTLDQRNRAKEGKSNQTESSRSTLVLRQTAESTKQSVPIAIMTSSENPNLLQACCSPRQLPGNARAGLFRTRTDGFVVPFGPKSSVDASGWQVAILGGIFAGTHQSTSRRISLRLATSTSAR